MKNFRGTGVALVTPFNSDKTIDENGLRKLVQLQVKGGTDFLVVQGTTGESPVLSPQEKNHVLDIVADENNGALPIVYGVGGNHTLSVVNQLKHLNHPAIDGLLSVSPYYNKPTQAGIIEHFKAVSAATELPIILYNVPGRTGSNMLPSTTLALAEIENIVAVKEASGNLEQVMEIIQHAPKDFLVLSGDDALTQPMIAAGAHGVISVVCNAFPELFSSMVRAALIDETAEARALHYELLKITHLFFAEGNPAGVKEALKVRAICDAFLRLPLVNVSSSLQKEIQEETERLLKQ
ncbi:MAG: 4-hydroxy-tetrahydrodipicolinate synthase [Lishizhenia sp.]